MTATVWAESHSALGLGTLTRPSLACPGRSDLCRVVATDPFVAIRAWQQSADFREAARRGPPLDRSNPRRSPQTTAGADGHRRSLSRTAQRIMNLSFQPQKSAG